jgi:transcriptional regulator with XRE-family HTH domain
MARADDLIDTGLAVFVLRFFKDWTQAELSAESGVDQGLISNYEQRKVKARRENMERLARAVGADLEWFEQLVSQCRGIRQHFERIGREGRNGASGGAAAAPDLQGKILEAVRDGVAPYLLQISPPDREPEPQPEDRAWAEMQWLVMEPLQAELQCLYVEILEEDERSWALAEKLCWVSNAVAAERPDEALRLALLAVQLAEQSPGSESWRRRLRGWCDLFVIQASGGPGRPDLTEPLLV